MKTLMIALALGSLVSFAACADDRNDDNDEGVSVDSIEECVAACVDRAVGGGSTEDCEQECRDVGR